MKTPSAESKCTGIVGKENGLSSENRCRHFPEKASVFSEFFARCFSGQKNCNKLEIIVVFFFFASDFGMVSLLLKFN